ncbi:MAG: DNA adenine methylase [Paludibacteraceae bacterium]|nr:DNA adenine methylase [Paludibacteraceae bacterium]
MKYMGSKQRIVNDILPIMLGQMFDRSAFVDMFCGGCSVISNVPVTYRRIANDKNKYLISMWKSLTDGRHRMPPMRLERDFYADVRDSYNKSDDRYSDAMKGWVGFMGSYNGRFFDGGYSGHDVVGKNGKSRDYIGENIRNTLSQIQSLKDVEFVCGDYSCLDLPTKSLIYCDIPYKGTKQYSTSANFDYERFYDWCVDMVQTGHKVFISEYNMPEDKFECVWQKQITNAMHQTNTKKPTERLFIPMVSMAK